MRHGVVSASTDPVQLEPIRLACARRWFAATGEERAEARSWGQAVRRCLDGKSTAEDRALVDGLAIRMVGPEELPGCPTCPHHEGELLLRGPAGVTCFACGEASLVVADPREAQAAAHRRRGRTA